MFNCHFIVSVGGLLHLRRAVNRHRLADRPGALRRRVGFLFLLAAPSLLAAPLFPAAVQLAAFVCFPAARLAAAQLPRAKALSAAQLGRAAARAAALLYFAAA